MPVCGSPAVLPQFAPPHAPGNWMCGRRWLDGVNTPSFAASRTSCFSFSCSSGLTNGFTSSGVIDCRANGGGLVGIGWVGDETSPGTSLFGTGRSSIGHSGVPVFRSNT